METAPAVSPVILLGHLALACAMGIGRFAFTASMPLMQANDRSNVLQALIGGFRLDAKIGEE